MPDGYYISERDWPDLQKLLRAWRSGRVVTSDQHGPANSSPPPAYVPCVVCLLEDLQPGQTALAERLVIDPINLGIDVHVLPPPIGEPATFPTAFKLVFNGQETPDLDPDSATAADVQDALAALPGAASRLGGVSLGNSPEHTLRRWRIRWARTAGEALPLSLVPDVPFNVALTRNAWHGTGSYITLRAPAAGHTLPAGTQCTAQQIPGAGWCLVADADPHTQIYVARVAETPIPAATEEVDVWTPGALSLPLYRIDEDGELAAVETADDVPEPVEATVYNLTPENSPTNAFVLVAEERLTGRLIFVGGSAGEPTPTPADPCDPCDEPPIAEGTIDCLGTADSLYAYELEPTEEEAALLEPGENIVLTSDGVCEWTGDDLEFDCPV
jgi:hypothetical protein